MPSCSRRNFLKTSSGLTAAALAGTMLPNKAEAGTIGPGPKNAAMAGRVVVNFNNRHAATQIGGTAADETILKKMVDDSIKLLTGLNTVGEAWKSIFPSTLAATSKIALKINILGSGTVPPHPFVVKGIIEGLLQMNVGTANAPATLPRSQLYIYDSNCDGSAKASKGFAGANFPSINLVNDDSMSNWGDGARSSNYANTLHTCDFLINVPGMRGHSSYAGNFTLGFKSHYGTYPAAYHDNTGTPPYLRDINCLGPVYHKTVLTICDAIFGNYESVGPSASASNYIYYAKKKDSTMTATASGPNTVIMSTDPVALEFQTIKIMRIQGNASTHERSYALSTLPSYLRASAGITGVLTPTYNIGVINEVEMRVGEIINEALISTGHELPDNDGYGERSSLLVHPNPTNPTAYFDFFAQEEMVGKKVRLTIFDVSGKIVHEADVPILGIKSHAVWNGLTSTGEQAASGRYLARLVIGRDVLKAAFTLVR